MDAMLTADSPQQLIDQLSVQRVMASEMRVQMNSYRTVSDQAAKAREASAKSAAEAKTAAEQAAAVRADLQSKQSQLQIQMAVVKSQFEALTPGQREALAAIPPPPPLPEAAPPAPQDPAIVAAPPEGGIPPGDVAPPDGALAPEAPGGTGEGMMAVQAALTRIGSPYSWGGSGPNQFDCSGLVMWAFQQAGISLPHSSQALARGGQPVDTSQMQPGDVVNYYSDASHVGDLHRRRDDGARVDLRHAGASGTGEQCPDLQRPPVLDVGTRPAADRRVDRWRCCLSADLTRSSGRTGARVDTRRDRGGLAHRDGVAMAAPSS